jgi:hypothetical protein
VTPFGHNTSGISASKPTLIAKEDTVEFTFTVTYAEEGTYDFCVNIKNMRGNSGKWNYEFNACGGNVSVVASSESELPDGFTFTSDGLLINCWDALGIDVDASNNGKNIIFGTSMNEVWRIS